MTALTRFDDMRNDFMLQPFDQMFRNFLRGADWPSARLPQDMRLDVSEDDRSYIVKAQIPGAKKEDIHVKVDRNYVSISAEIREEKKESQKQNGGRVLLQETHYGSLERGFALPSEVDGKETTAKYDAGVLTLTLPKRGPSTSKTIAIE